MIKSMTGFAAVRVDREPVTVEATMRTVNHRFLDLQIRAPQSLAAEEPRLRGLVQRRISRGRVELSVTIERRPAGRVEVSVDDALLAQLARAVEEARAKGLIEGPITPGDMLRTPQVVSLVDRPVDPAEESAVAEAAATAVAQAADAVDRMRITEGSHLHAELDGRLEALAGLVDHAEVAAQGGAETLRQRLADRAAELAGEAPLDPTLLAQEIVKLVARSDVTEELVRLRGHVTHWRMLADGSEPCGRKLEFLLQEMNREVNTLGAKAEGGEVSVLIVEAKAELEKLREQVQNVE